MTTPHDDAGGRFRGGASGVAHRHSDLRGQLKLTRRDSGGGVPYNLVIDRLSFIAHTFCFWRQISTTNEMGRRDTMNSARSDGRIR